MNKLSNLLKRSSKKSYTSPKVGVKTIKVVFNSYSIKYSEKETQLLAVNNE